ncbi:MAG: SMI1/KNR4 family protein [Isosphaeraceae bacterium]
MSEFDIRRFQDFIGFRLPEEYALFLTTIGNGGAGPEGVLLELDLSQPGLEKPARLPFPDQASLERDRTFVSASQFILTRDGTIRVSNRFFRRGNSPASAEDYNNYDDEDVTAHYFIMVVNGPDTGKVWKCDPPVHFRGRTFRGRMCPAVSKDGSQATFLVWYEEWLDSVLGP